MKSFLVLASLAAPLLAQAAYTGVIDPAGDLIPTFTGSSSSTDLDVTQAAVFYDATTNMFRLESTMAGPIGMTTGAAYVWGVNLGTGTAGFAAQGYDGIRFNTVLIVRPDLTLTRGGTVLPATVVISGNTITADFSASALTSTGFAPSDYTWNLWPRDTTQPGFGAIADFAPDQINFLSQPGVVAVPEPASAVLMLLGVAGMVGLRRRQK